MARVLLLLPTTTYRAPDFLAAAKKLGVEVTVASDEPSAVESLNPEGLMTLDFGDPVSSARRVAELAKERPLTAVVGVDEDTAVAAAVIARELGLPHNPVSAAAAARHKATMRRLLAEAAVPSPVFQVFDRGENAEDAARVVSYPCVLKPTFLAASRGVIRANDESEFISAWRRIEKIHACRQRLIHDASPIFARVKGLPGTHPDDRHVERGPAESAAFQRISAYSTEVQPVL